MKPSVLLLCISAAVVVSAYDAVSLQRRRIVDKGNAWVDDFIEGHREQLRRLVAGIKFPDADFSVGPARIRLSNGYVSNLEELFRIGDWELVRLVNDELRLNLLLGVDDAVAGYDCFAQLGPVGLRKKIRVSVQRVRLKVEATQFFGSLGNEGVVGENILNFNAHAQLRLHLVGIHVDVRALGFPFDQFLSAISTAVVQNFKRDIFNLVKTAIRDFVYKVNGF